MPGSVDPTLWAVVTKRLGQALTTAFALAHHYSAEVGQAAVRACDAVVPVHDVEDAVNKRPVWERLQLT